ncbi:MAG: hypothetical protein QOI55_2148 [Actinomycetota bacterium]|nr:hypothetical protein [Actinomycetota bacterium]
MQDRPTAAELVAAVRAFLEDDVMPAVDGRVAFHTRVAVNALGIVERELELGPELDAGERARAAALLGHDGEPRSLEAELARAIRHGDLTFDDRAVVEHVRATVRDKLRIANPKYVG